LNRSAGTAALYRAAADLKRPLAALRQLTSGVASMAWLTDPNGAWGCREFDDLGRDSWRIKRTEEAKRRLAVLPPAASLETAIADLRAAEAAPSDRQTATALIGLMLSAFPNGRPPDAESYFTALAHYATEGGHSPLVVALGCDRVVKTSTFLPAVAEFLQHCQASKIAEIDRAIGTADYVLKLVHEAETVLAEPRSLPRRPAAVAAETPLDRGAEMLVRN
jgi:hypothetical protein